MTFSEFFSEDAARAEGRNGEFLMTGEMRMIDHKELGRLKGRELADSYLILRTLGVDLKEVPAKMTELRIKAASAASRDDDTNGQRSLGENWLATCDVFFDTIRGKR